MDRIRLEMLLQRRFDADPDTAQIVARQAGDLADAGLIEQHLGFELTPDAVLDNIGDAPDEYTLVERWNWWIGSLELSHGGYDRFQIRPDVV